MIARIRSGPRILRISRPLFLITLMWFMPMFAYAEDRPVIISHPSVSTHSLSRDALLAMFAMHSQRWSDGQRIKVFVLQKDHPVHKAFTTEVLGTYPYQLERIWRRLVYSGTGRAPQVCADEEEMQRRVLSTPGAIGYVGTTKEGDLNVIRVE